jgi:hypothetical protein
MSRILMLLAVGLVLSGCSIAGPPPASDVVLPQRQQASAAQLAAETEARAKTQDAQCLSYGLKPGSPGYKKCRTDLAQLDDARQPAPVAAQAATPAPATTVAEAPRRSRPMLDDDSPERVFNVCSYGGTITNCY